MIDPAHNETVKTVIDTISVATVVATLATWLPPIAALLSIVWTALRIWEMITGKTLADRRKERRNISKRK